MATPAVGMKQARGMMLMFVVAKPIIARLHLGSGEASRLHHWLCVSRVLQFLMIIAICLLRRRPRE
jgi:hypothetical protein